MDEREVLFEYCGQPISDDEVRESIGLILNLLKKQIVRSFAAKLR